MFFYFVFVKKHLTVNPNENTQFLKNASEEWETTDFLIKDFFVDLYYPLKCFS